MRAACHEATLRTTGPIFVFVSICDVKLFPLRPGPAQVASTARLEGGIKDPFHRKRIASKNNKARMEAPGHHNTVAGNVR
jgi:hypothetical protein